MQSRPPCEEIVLDTEHIKDPADSMVDDVLNRLRFMIKGRDRRKNDGAHLCQLDHVSQVPQMKRGLSRQYHQPLSLLMIDIDWFKKYNDNYGHLFGNLILRDLAQIIKGCIRDVDILVRYGGEEFVVILPQTSKEDARNIGERIRSKVEQTQFEDKDEKLKVKITVSLGVATYPENGVDPEELIKRVDQALYLAKGKGKNLICTV